MVGTVRFNEIMSKPELSSSTSLDDTPFVLAHGATPFEFYDTVSASLHIFYGSDTSHFVLGIARRI